MAKTNAQKQREYRERKKLNDPKFLEKERKRQKAYYVKTSNLSKKELKERRIDVKERVRRSRDQKKILLENLRNENSYASSTDTMSNDADTDGTISPMIVSIPFPKRGEASRKRKRRSDDKFYKKIPKLENERKKLKQKCNSLRKKIARRSRKKENSSTPNSKTTNMMRAAGILPEDAPDIKKQLLFAQTISREIQEKKKNRKQSIRSTVSGNILKKYRLIRYAATKTNTNRRKLSKVKSKVINLTKSKRGFEP